MNAIVPRATIDQIVASRNQALALYADAYDALQLANGHVQGASHTKGMHSTPYLALDRHSYRSSDSREQFINSVRPNMDRAIWSYLIEISGMERLMDAKARQEFQAQLETDPPEVSADTARATMQQLIGDADLIFKRGIANAFSGLDRRFRSHDGFKIGSRVILSNFYNSGTINSRQKDVLRDIERTFHVLEGKPQPDYLAGVCGQMETARQDASRPGSFGLGNIPFEMDGAYFKVRAFKNGNAHLWFTRDDLVERVNLLLADYYGAALGEGVDVVDPGFAPSGKVARNLGFFETPDALVETVLEASGLGRRGESLTVLEPSAGLGRIAMAAQAKGAKVTCVEIHEGRIASLRAAGLPTIGGDFLHQSPEVLGLFDAVLMNPPFDRGLDVEHVSHALRFLKPGGVLVSIMSASSEFRQDARALALQSAVEKWSSRWDRPYRDLPAGSFAESGTYVNTTLLTIRRPKNQ